MILQNLVLENFKSFKDETILDFSVKNKEKNIILI
jgi:chromosome segregation ATPase